LKSIFFWVTCIEIFANIWMPKGVRWRLCWCPKSKL
jgi:hypothetical protein